jgi:hypothetical protein
MLRTVLVSVICLLVWGPPANADIIYLKNGNVLEVDSAEVKGEFVVFSIFNGTMSIDLLAVERIEKSERAAGNTRLTGSIGGPVTGESQSGQQTAAAQGLLGSETGTAEEEANAKEQMIQFYIAQKQQIERENYFYRQQIDTLNSVIYAKAVIFSDTTPERDKIQQMEGLIRQNDEKIQQLLTDARTQNLLPGDIRRIEDAKFEPPAGTETQQPQPDFDSSEPEYDNTTEEKIYSEEEGEEGEEGTEQQEVPPPTQ